MNKGGFINHVSGLPATRTHHCRFANNFAVNHSYAFEASQAATRFFKSDFHDHLITRHDRTLEARFIDTREVVQFTRLHEWVETSHGVTIKADLKFEDIASFEDADMLMIPVFVLPML